MKLLILADCHANWPALRAVSEQEPECDAIVALGDLVINGPLPAETIAWHRERATWSVRGNHDEKLLAAARGNLRAEGSRARILAALQAATLPEPDLDYLRGLPTLLRFEFGGATFCAVHGSMSQRTIGSLSAETDPLLLRAELDQARADFLLAGHTHRPLLRTYRGMTLLNPGAVGQPRDGDPRAQYVVWDDGLVSFRRAVYDVDETITAMERSGCPQEYLPGLIQGWREGLNPSALQADEGEP
jgi:putative phosphoesterase